MLFLLPHLFFSIPIFYCEKWAHLVFCVSLPHFRTDPYFMKNHLGSFECKLCLTLHTTEGNYLAHTQGKRHQQNLGRRAAREEQVSGRFALQLG